MKSFVTLLLWFLLVSTTEAGPNKKNKNKKNNKKNNKKKSPKPCPSDVLNNNKNRCFRSNKKCVYPHQACPQWDAKKLKCVSKDVERTCTCSPVADERRNLRQRNQNKKKPQTRHEWRCPRPSCQKCEAPEEEEPSTVDEPPSPDTLIVNLCSEGNGEVAFTSCTTVDDVCQYEVPGCDVLNPTTGVCEPTIRYDSCQCADSQIVELGNVWMCISSLVYCGEDNPCEQR